jgi:hypothetical protein
MSGQSNMQMPLRGYSSQPVLRSNDAVARANDRNLRLFSVAHAVADEPADDVVGRWETSTSANAFDEAQLNTMLNVPNTGMASTMNLGLERNIHPPEKILVGQRLAYWALANTYGMEAVRYSGPVSRKMTVEEGAAVLEFDHAPDGLSSFGAELAGFTLAGEDKSVPSRRSPHRWRRQPMCLQ